MKEFIKQFFYLLDQQAKRKLPVLFLSFVMTSLLDVVSIGLIGVFLIMLSTNNPLSILKTKPWLYQYVKNCSQNELIVLFGITILIALITKAMVTLIIQREVVKYTQTLQLRMTTRFMRAYQYAPYSYYLQHNSSISGTRIGQASGFVHYVVSPLISLCSSVMIGVFILISLFIMAPIATSSLLGIFLLMGIVQDFFVKERLMTAGEQMAALGGESGKISQHIFQGIKEIRILGKENYFLQRFIFLNKQSLKAATTIANWSLAPRYLIENSMAVFIIGLSFAALASGYNSSMIVATIGMFAMAGIRLLPVVTNILVSINSVRSIYPTMKLTYSYMLELEQLEQIVYLREASPTRRPNLTFSSVIVLDKISFTYPAAKRAALSQVSMCIRKGQSIGLIGPSGSGKSTLINIILGLLSPETGQMLIDGHPINDMRDWLDHLGYIPQTIFLMDDTLKHNIAMGIEDSEINNEKLWEVIEMAQLQELVEQLPQGIETLIGESGIRLSGGQRQRVALARTLYSERDVIVMDEATSSLDNETEKEVIKAIKQLKGVKTTIVIAHRLTTVEHCDVLFRLEKGRITKVGSFKEVVSTV